MTLEMDTRLSRAHSRICLAARHIHRSSTVNQERVTFVILPPHARNYRARRDSRAGRKRGAAGEVRWDLVQPAMMDAALRPTEPPVAAQEWKQWATSSSASSPAAPTASTSHGALISMLF